MKRWTLLLPAAALTLVACGGNGTASSPATSAATSGNDTAATASGLSKAEGCQEAIKLQSQLPADGKAASFTQSAEAYGSLLTKVDDDRLKSLLTVVRDVNTSSAADAQAGKPVEMVKGAKAYADLMEYCTT